MITQELVKSRFDYREDGNLIWKIKPAQSVKIGDIAGGFKSRGYIHTRIGDKKYSNHRLVWLWPIMAIGQKTNLTTLIETGQIIVLKTCAKSANHAI